MNAKFGSFIKIIRNINEAAMFIISLVAFTLLEFMMKFTRRILVPLLVIYIIFIIGYDMVVQSFQALSTSFSKTAAIAAVQTVIEENWVKIVFLALFYWVWSIYKLVNRISTDIGQIKIGVVAIGNYLQIAAETEGMVKLQKKGPWSLFSSNFSLWIAAFFIPLLDTDDRLTAKPVRHGERVSLEADLSAALSKRESYQ